MWQGPHQSAQQSSSTGIFDRSTTVSKFASVTTTGTVIRGSGALHLPHLPWSAARPAGTRLTARQLGHVTSIMSSSLPDPTSAQLRPPP